MRLRTISTEVEKSQKNILNSPKALSCNGVAIMCASTIMCRRHYHSISGVRLRTVRIFTQYLNNKPIYCRGGYYPPAPYTPTQSTHRPRNNPPLSFRPKWRNLRRTHRTHKLSAGLSCRPPRRSPRRAHGVKIKKIKCRIILPA